MRFVDEYWICGVNKGEKDHVKFTALNLFNCVTGKLREKLVTINDCNIR